MRLLPLVLCLLSSCAAVPPSGMQRVNLRGDCRQEFAALAAAFARANPGHALDWFPGIAELGDAPRPRVLLVQNGATRAHVQRAAVAEAESEVVVGDVLVLSPGESVRFDGPVDVLAFTVPDDLSPEVPRVIRPDQDPRITDTPGGCATDAHAYRRVLLTWLDRNGPYTFHGLNIHRVRMDDSFTHYHPLEGGFEELYLVQAVRPGAKVISSERTFDILRPETITRADVGELLEHTELQVGDLVYLPRGTAHRGIGGVLAQVITVPGFVPGSEIGIDHHLRAINERLGLAGEAALPYHEQGSLAPVIR